MNQMNNFISYSNILKDRQGFREAGTRHGSEFNLADTSSTKYFKLFFYFNNGDVEGYDNSQGLLTPVWNEAIDMKEWYKRNSAWTYLKMNCEDERADRLVDFVNLLSNISAESPWYFSELNGLDAALERKAPHDKEFKIDEERKKLSIKCLPDAYDDRIGTLLDLYRSIVWSWTNKREVLPSNLRKFDMGILIFESVVTPFHHIQKKKLDTSIVDQYTDKLSKKLTEDEYASLGNNSEYGASYKYIEFHNCEFDYNSSKSPYGSLNNKEGVQLEYNIDIYFDDCYESRYNEFILKELGDFVLFDWDHNDVDNDNRDARYEGNIEKLEQRVNYYNNSFKDTLLDELKGTAQNIGEGVLNRIVLGNIYTLSLSRLADQAQGAASGHVWSTARGLVEYANDINQHINGGLKYVNKIGNIFKAETLKNNL